MADQPEEADDDLDLKPARAGTMFRLEMFTTNFLLGYWKHLLATVVTILVLILAVGQYHDYARRNQREAAARIAKRLSDLPDEIPYLSERLARGETLDAATLETTGDDLVAIGNGSNGTARVEAFLTAAELFRLANKTDKERAALTEAVQYGTGVLGYSAAAGLANLELAQGEGDAAVDRLRKLAADNEGYLAEQAEIDLALALEHLGRNDEATQVYEGFLTRFPESTRRSEVEQRRNRLAAGGQG